jgi:hypothetical protein
VWRDINHFEIDARAFDGSESAVTDYFPVHQGNGVTTSLRRSLFWRAEGDFAKPDQTCHDSILPRFGCDTDRAAPVWRGLWSVEFQKCGATRHRAGF